LYKLEDDDEDDAIELILASRFLSTLSIYFLFAWLALVRGYLHSQKGSFLDSMIQMF